jgi:hypothetical protein
MFREKTPSGDHREGWRIPMDMQGVWERPISDISLKGKDLP